ncbi:phosphotransferase [Dactylosporangium sp. CS-033363]|uniref:phosphotransferase n=1 Tax=Dactylosporangium sp. CS-033363 TaxID=3239935 RepID=UPI003D8DB658
MRIDVANHAARLGLIYEGPCTGGEIGAGFVRWPDGREGVLGSGNPASVPLLRLARAAGIPAPSYDLVDGPVIVQSRLPGSPPAAFDTRLTDEMLAASARCEGLLRGTSFQPLRLYLHEPGPGFCHHDALAAASPRTAALLASIRAVPLTELPGDDLVHFDFHPGNVLVSPTGALTGVVDWDGAGRGTRALDVVTMLFYATRRAPALVPRLRALAFDLAPRPVVEACWAHISLRQVDWSLRFHAPEEASAWVAVAEQGL